MANPRAHTRHEEKGSTRFAGLTIYISIVATNGVGWRGVSLYICVLSPSILSPRVPLHEETKCLMGRGYQNPSKLGLVWFGLGIPMEIPMGIPRSPYIFYILLQTLFSLLGVPAALRNPQKKRPPSNFTIFVSVLDVPAALWNSQKKGAPRF